MMSGRYSNERSNPTGCTSWIAAMPNLPCSIRSWSDSSYVCRLRDNSAYEVLKERPLTESDRQAGVLSDQIVQFGSGKAEARPDHEIRLVCVKTTPHTKRGKNRGGGSTGPGSDGVLRIATNLVDVPAEIIGLI